MDLVDVNVICPQTSKAVFDSIQDMFATQTEIVWARSHAKANLGRDHKIRPVFSFYPAAQNFFGCSGGIHIGRVNKIAAHFHEAIQNLETVLFGCLARSEERRVGKECRCRWAP